MRPSVAARMVRASNQMQASGSECDGIGHHMPYGVGPLQMGPTPWANHSMIGFQRTKENDERIGIVTLRGISGWLEKMSGSRESMVNDKNVTGQTIAGRSKWINKGTWVQSGYHKDK